MSDESHLLGWISTTDGRLALFKNKNKNKADVKE
jgi:hypothetical protein